MRAQMEMMGLAIIVILISLGLLFVIRFILPSEGTDPNEIFSQSSLASDFLNTLVESNSDLDCHHIKFSTLFQDCADKQEISCNGMAACDYIDEKLRKVIFNNTFESWNMDYYFIVSTDMKNLYGTKLINPIGEECPLGRRRTTQPLPANQPIFLVLDICLNQ